MWQSDTRRASNACGFTVCEVATAVAVLFCASGPGLNALAAAAAAADAKLQLLRTQRGCLVFCQARINWRDRVSVREWPSACKGNRI